MKLSKQQQPIIDSTASHILVIACPGTGKTMTMVAKQADLIKNKNVAPENILSLTFTRKAAGEMEERLEQEIGSQAHDIFSGTFHSICFDIIRTEYKGVKFWELAGFRNKNITVYNDNDRQDMLNYIIDELHYKKKLKKKDMKKMFADYGSEGWKPDSSDTEKYLVFRKYYEECIASNALDFNMILNICNSLIDPESKDYSQEVFEYVHNQFRYVFVDEYQDTNRVQFVLHHLIQPEFLFVVGDPDQCQLPDTMVLTNKGYKRICELHPEKDKLVSYDRRGSNVIGFKKGYEFKIKQTHYEGYISYIATKNMDSNGTFNHKWIVKWNNKKIKRNICVVYLMRKDNNFRIGWCQLFNSEGSFHLGIRNRIEEADCCWIIHVAKDKVDASLMESYYSIKFSIPTITFKQINNAKLYTKESIKEFFNKFESLELYKNALKLLEFKKLYMSYPIYNKLKRYQKQGGTSIFEIETCNLIPELMMLPEHIKGKKVKWEEIIKIKNVYYLGEVHSLDVEKYNLYISDGLVTHNCIYHWRGSDINIILHEFKNAYPNSETFKLTENYRSHEDIIQVANNLIKYNNNRYKMEMVKAKNNNTDIYETKIISSPTEEQLYNVIVKKIREINPVMLSDIVILSRNHQQNTACKKVLDLNNISAKQIGLTNEFFDMHETILFHAYLLLSNDPRDTLNFKRYFEIEKVNYMLQDEIKQYSYQIRKSFLNAYLHSSYPSISTTVLWTKLYNLKDEPNNLLNIIDLIIEDSQREVNNRYKITFKMGVEKFRDKLKEIIEVNNISNFEQYIKFYTYYRDNQIYDKESQHEINNDNKINLMTIHAAKGLEFKYIFIIGMNEGILPHSRAIKKGNEGIEEERRVCYVAVTRAIKQLYLCYPESTVNIYTSKSVKKKVSRFIGECKIKSEVPF